MATFRPGKFKDSLQASSFGLEIEGESVGTFQKCTGITTKNEIITENKSKHGKSIVQKQPGSLAVGDITLERGYTDNMDLYNWRDEIVNGNVSTNRKDCSVVVYNVKDEEVARFNIFDCWPAELSGPELDASSNDIAIEKVVLACERIERDM
mgnify:CR=1 FL=1